MTLCFLSHPVLSFATFSSYCLNVLTFQNPILVFHFMPKWSPLISDGLLFISVSLKTVVRVCRLLACSTRSQNLVQHCNKWRDPMNTETNFWIRNMTRNYLTSCADISFRISTLFNRVSYSLVWLMSLLAT